MGTKDTKVMQEEFWHLCKSKVIQSIWLEHGVIEDSILIASHLSKDKNH